MTTIINRYVTVASIDDISVGTEPVLEPAAGQVRVRTTLAGICGSDLHAAHGVHPSMPLPYRPGHEVVGVVDALGAGVDAFAVGDRVLLEPNLVCGTCRNCRRGRYNICASLAVFGCQTPGGMADMFSVAADRLHRIPADMSDAAAVLVEPLATPVHAAELAGDLTGAKVVVLGSGTIGFLTMIAARRAGAATVLCTDLREDNLARATRFGAEYAVPANDPDLPGTVAGLLGEVDVVFDCVANAGSVSQAVTIVAKGGTIIVVGVPAGPVSVPLDLVQDHEITLRGCLMYTGKDIRVAMDMLTHGAVPTNELTSSVFPLDKAADAFSAAASGEHGKVLVSVNPAQEVR
jgi:2-desacetyl-2-hydroxyethyl bacteriochlorophyllide A dehydrogenase